MRYKDTITRNKVAILRFKVTVTRKKLVVRSEVTNKVIITRKKVATMRNCFKYEKSYKTICETSYICDSRNYEI